ncbi:hypothetical protein S3E15_03912 [Bacillus mycoides]|uniref:Uncharacterized protein n=1 Tax=Bacillus mycoides TaxID=1405 RepID=A0AAP7W3Z6_BACMY|nr:hypothetical protein S3E15_03912 [Bacillus mycoides]
MIEKSLFLFPIPKKIKFTTCNSFPKAENTNKSFEPVTKRLDGVSFLNVQMYHHESKKPIQAKLTIRFSLILWISYENMKIEKNDAF